VPWITRRSEGRSCTAPSPSRPRGPRAAIASEFTKIGSVRSTYWTLAALLIVSVGIGAAACAGLAANISNNAVHKAGFDATQDSLFVFFEIGQLIIAVLGALTITAEYSTGMIGTSLTAMPRRGVVYAAKAIVFTSVTLVISLVTSFVAFFLGQALLSSSGVSASLFHTVKIPANAMRRCVTPAPGGGSVPIQGGGPGDGPILRGCLHSVVTFSGTDVISSSTVLRAVIGTALFVTVVAVIAFGLGAIIRHTAGTIGTVIGVMFVIPIIVQALPNNWAQDMVRFMPSSAGQVLSVTINGNGNGNGRAGTSVR
jgi:ABC-2 type transport system permease protein